MLLHREVYNGSPREKRNGKEKPTKRKVVEITLNIYKRNRNRKRAIYIENLVCKVFALFGVIFRLYIVGADA